MRMFPAVLGLLILSHAAHAALLPRNALICPTGALTEEALSAAASGDYDHLHRLQRRGCFAARDAIEADRIDCEGHACRVRLNIPGIPAAEEYTLRRYLY